MRKENERARMSNPDGNNYAPTNIFSLIDYENKSMLGEADVGC